MGGILGELPEETRIVIPDKTAIEIPVIKEPPASKGKDENQVEKNQLQKNKSLRNRLQKNQIKINRQ